MNARHTAVRVLFLFVVMLVQGRPSFAAAPDFQEDCNEYCSMGVRVHECTFADWGYGSGYDASSVCNSIECYIVVCTSETELDPLSYYRGLCGGWATGAGQQGQEWFSNYSCSGYDGTAEGAFYCSYLDQSCTE